jgi:TRAP-type mannitol/chloroaromatic compound transport system substrate-binding protein
LSAGLGVPAEPFRLVMPVVYGTHLPGLAELAAQLAKLVDQLSGGALELDLKQPGDGTQPQEILDKVSHGSVDAGFSTASFWGAKIPAAALHEIDAAAFLTTAVDQHQRVQDHGTLKREGSTRGRARTASGAVRATDWSSNTR